MDDSFKYRIITADKLPALARMPLLEVFSDLKEVLDINPDLIFLRECTDPNKVNFTYDARIGGLSTREGEIYIVKRTFKEMLRVLYHEFMHAFQHTILSNRDIHPQAVYAVVNMMEEEAETFAQQSLKDWREANPKRYKDAQHASRVMMIEATQKGEARFNKALAGPSYTMGQTPKLMKLYNQK